MSTFSPFLIYMPSTFLRLRLQWAAGRYRRPRPFILVALFCWHTHPPILTAVWLLKSSLFMFNFTIFLTYCTIMSIIVRVSKEINLFYSSTFYNKMIPPYFYIKYQITSQSYITTSFYQITPSFLTVTPSLFTAHSFTIKPRYLYFSH